MWQSNNVACLTIVKELSKLNWNLKVSMEDHFYNQYLQMYMKYAWVEHQASSIHCLPSPQVQFWKWGRQTAAANANSVASNLALFVHSPRTQLLVADPLLKILSKTKYVINKIAIIILTSYCRVINLKFVTLRNTNKINEWIRFDGCTIKLTLSELKKC